MTKDIWDEATEAKLPPLKYWGQLSADASAVALIRGRGKESYDPAKHNPALRRVQVELTLDPLDEMNMTRGITRTLITNNTDWINQTWKSAQDLGLQHARELNGKWCRCVLENTGREYTNSHGAKVTATTLVFEKFFADKAACVEDYRASQSSSSEKASENAAGEDVHNENGKASPRQTALEFLPLLVKQAGADPKVLAGLLANMDFVNKFFTIDSPEVQALLEAEAA